MRNSAAVQQLQHVPFLTTLVACYAPQPLCDSCMMQWKCSGSHSAEFHLAVQRHHKGAHYALLLWDSLQEKERRKTEAMKQLNAETQLLPA